MVRMALDQKLPAAEGGCRNEGVPKPRARFLSHIVTSTFGGLDCKNMANVRLDGLVSSLTLPVVYGPIEILLALARQNV